MRIGVYIKEIQPESGGGYSVVEEIYNQILNVKSNHEFYLYSFNDFNQRIDCKNNVIKCTLEKRRSNKYSLLFRLINKLTNNLLIRQNEMIQELNYFGDFDNPLNIKILKDKIDLFWFPTPEYFPIQIPYIYTIWDVSHKLLPVFPEFSQGKYGWSHRENLYRAALSKATRVIVGTDEGRKQVLKFYNINSYVIRVIPLPVIENFEKAILNPKRPDVIREGEKFYFYPAQFWAHKNHKLIVEAMNIVKKKDNTIKFYFCGSDKGNLEFIESLINKYNLQDTIINLGFISSQELYFLYKNAIAMIFPSFLGPDNVPPIEAFVTGCPSCISSDVELHQHLVGYTHTFCPNNPKELASLMMEMINNIDFRNQYLNLNKKYLEINYSRQYIEMILEEIESISEKTNCFSNEYKHKYLDN